MTFIRRFMDFLNANASPATPGQTPPPPAQPVVAPETTTNTQPDNGHIRRKTIMFKHVGSDDMVDDSEERWSQNGTVFEGETVKTKVISASGQITDADKLNIRCHACGKDDNSPIRSEKSHVPLCINCQRTFEMPDGRNITVTPQEEIQLKREFNTWARYDARRKGLIQ